MQVVEIAEDFSASPCFLSFSFLCKFFLIGWARKAPCFTVLAHGSSADVRLRKRLICRARHRTCWTLCLKKLKFKILAVLKEFDLYLLSLKINMCYLMCTMTL